MQMEENKSSKFWSISRNKKSLVLFSAGLIVLSLLQLAITWA